METYEVKYELFISIVSSLSGLHKMLIRDIAEMLQRPLVMRVRHLYRFPLLSRRGVVEASRSWDFFLGRAKARLAKAYKLLREGLEDEAGEEAWRATIDAVNALAVVLWDVEIRSHEVMSKLVGKLKEMKIVDITVEYGNADSLHGNYYHPHLDPITVEANINQVERLIEKIEATIKNYHTYLEEYVQIPVVPILRMAELLKKEFSIYPSRLIIPAPRIAIEHPTIMIK